MGQRVELLSYGGGRRHRPGQAGGGVGAAGEVLLRGLAWCGGVYGVLWLLGRAWG